MNLILLISNWFKRILSHEKAKAIRLPVQNTKSEALYSRINQFKLDTERLKSNHNLASRHPVNSAIALSIQNMISDSTDPRSIICSIFNHKIADDVKSLYLFIPQLSRKFDQTDMRGIFVDGRSNANSCLSYIRSIYFGECICSQYLLEPHARFSSPNYEEQLEKVSIATYWFDEIKATANWDLTCAFCNKKFHVQEHTGWHLPTLTWTLNESSD
jgi:hypothetical protein